MGLFYDHEFDGNIFRIKPPKNETTETILGLPPILFGALLLAIIILAVALFNKR